MWQYNDMSVLCHFGIKGMKWGVRRARPPSTFGQKIKINKDGSREIPVGFKFNRVGKADLDINQSGALYVSYGKQDASRYIRSLGPTPIGKLLGTAGTNLQRINVNSTLKIPSDKKLVKETANLLLNNKRFFKIFNESIYSSVIDNSFEPLKRSTIEIALKNPSGKEAGRLNYGVSSLLGDGNYKKEAKIYYEHLRNKGYDAIPDAHDILSGTSKTGMIIINPSKVTLTASKTITKEDMKRAKVHIKKIGKLKISDFING